MDTSTKAKLLPCTKTIANKKFTVDKQFKHGFSALSHDEKIREYCDTVHFLDGFLTRNAVEMPEAPPPDVHTFQAYFQENSMVILKKWVSESISV